MNKLSFGHGSLWINSQLLQPQVSIISILQRKMNLKLKLWTALELWPILEHKSLDIALIQLENGLHYLESVQMMEGKQFLGTFNSI